MLGEDNSERQHGPRVSLEQDQGVQAFWVPEGGIIRAGKQWSQSRPTTLHNVNISSTTDLSCGLSQVSCLPVTHGPHSERSCHGDAGSNPYSTLREPHRGRSYIYDFQHFILSNKKISQVPVAHACHPSYLGGWHQEDCSSRSSQAKKLVGPHLTRKKKA
jgi:hypothetical protein